MDIKTLGVKSKYETLVNILDKLRLEAPVEFKRYHPIESDIEKVNQARARTFIHLYLKVKFGMLDFKDREKYITDDPYDGGIDAYYIDDERKNIYFIQSKFRTNENNFETKEISLAEILNMEIDRILAGELIDEYGNEYNSKVKGMIDRIKSIEDIARYNYQVVLLANIKGVNDITLKKLTAGFPCKVFDFNKCYDNLVFPVVSGTYYNEADLFINLNLANKEFSQSRISYPVETSYSNCEITILFVPTLEIAKTLYKYKNSILKHNPRSYLDLSYNQVNREIARTIRDKSTNEFSLFNNGITILSDETSLNERIGQKGKGQLHIKNPQIINGGQTAYTLSKVYEESLKAGSTDQIFLNKEVMLKIITFTGNEELTKDKIKSKEDILKLIEEISKATNQQTAVNDSDRISNDKIQMELQKYIFENFGYFYERKKGEFYDGLQNRYIDKSKIIDREAFLRACYSIAELPSPARRNSQKDLFKKDILNKVLQSRSFEEMFFAYSIFKKLDQIQKVYNRQPNNKFGVVNYGYALRYGKLAVITVAYLLLPVKVTPFNIEELVEELASHVLDMWIGFEDYVKEQPHNKDYFIRMEDIATGDITLEVNFDGYYKGRTLINDIRSYFSANLVNKEIAATIQD